MYAVVLFDKTNEVEVVPSSWIDGDKCLWTDHLKSTTVTKATEPNVSPTADWRPYSVTVRRQQDKTEEEDYRAFNVEGKVGMKRKGNFPSLSLKQRKKLSYSRYDISSKTILSQRHAWLTSNEINLVHGILSDMFPKVEGFHGTCALEFVKNGHILSTPTSSFVQIVYLNSHWLTLSNINSNISNCVQIPDLGDPD
ncbi:uncharacterized protein LOC106164688 [Lingula anatina]|uniref:Uncharacterized protein LOC106164688 n=1 Tax=Lingula anatina TaxID=7574 RepID=A0A1S3IJR4_LINAN|nr:uncharacterized protein LOC106164688 [Lingula anatina]|eukprot:XP_013398126.1 uncharacterized protein LOC106164688 [Lingula anatina]